MGEWSKCRRTGKRKAAAVSYGRFLKAYILLARISVIWPQWAAREAGKCSLYFISRGERDHKYWRNIDILTVILVTVSNCFKLSLLSSSSPKSPFVLPFFPYLSSSPWHSFSCLSIHKPMYFLFHFSFHLYFSLCLLCMSWTFLLFSCYFAFTKVELCA